MMEKLQKDYKWLFSKQKAIVINGKRKFQTIELNPVIEDAGSHWRIYREPNASPLILSKDY